MMSSNERKRRVLMAAVAALPWNAAVAIGSGSNTVRKTRSRVLVAYFSRSGNTRVVAGLLQRAFEADVFEMRPADPYPEEYLATVEQARQERDSGFAPALAARLTDIGTYDTVYLGFPIWGETAPPVVRSFLATHDLTGKTLTPFVTHGGYGLGNGLSVLASLAPLAKMRSPFVMEADQERKTLNLVNEWLDKTDLTREPGAS
ncbi:flavodoxin [Caballeronia sp. LZ033]|uniref:flavodoxin n=1 Tax=Caballeronia sp. LZ033 TaxID=3038566 RepID=UPI002863066F|nr:flavodoxin [Caballeronia sp. LZ033]MDR5815647.1 flavodoxin [Caballeronia sp. LZ033]